MSVFGVVMVRIFPHSDQNNSKYGHFSLSVGYSSQNLRRNQYQTFLVLSNCAWYLYFVSLVFSGIVCLDCSHGKISIDFILTQSSFTASERERDYYPQRINTRAALRVAERLSCLICLSNMLLVGWILFSRLNDFFRLFRLCPFLPKVKNLFPRKNSSCFDRTWSDPGVQDQDSYMLKLGRLVKNF